MRPYRQQGLTLPELLVSLTLIVTLSVNAYGQFSHALQENRMATEVNRFVTALHLARSEAVRHGQRVVLCPSPDGESCGKAQHWLDGWLLFASDDQERDHHEHILHRGNPLAHGIAMTASNHRKRIVYQQGGSSGGSNAAFTFCDTRGLAAPRVICLSNSGRPRLTLTRCDGKPIEC